VRSSEEYNLIKIKILLSQQRIHIKNNVVVRCGLEKEKSDGGVTRGLIPTHVQETERTNKASQGMPVFLPKHFWISETNI
jgi:hypothetical protein